MGATSVTSKGQVTIPREVRNRLGIRRGTRVAISVEGDHAVLRLSEDQRQTPPPSGFGMLKTRRAPVPVGFDAASLIKR